VKASQPHLHFAVSIKPAENRPEKYIDPEPLIALWPMRVPMNGTELGLVTLTAQPGVPLGSMPRLSARARRAATLSVAGAEQAPTAADVEPDEGALAGPPAPEAAPESTGDE
jgi:hypothetical protein